MNGLLLGLASAALGTSIHMILLRFVPNRLRLVILPPWLLTVCLLLGLTMARGFWTMDAADWAVAVVLVLSLGLAYALLLNGVVHDSPTLALVNEIESHGAAGMPSTAFESFVARHPFVQSRLEPLIAGRELSLKEDRLELT